MLDHGVAVSCGVGCRPGSDPALLWPWCRPAAASPIQPLAWGPPYAAAAAQEMAKRPKNKKRGAKCFISKKGCLPEAHLVPPGAHCDQKYI